MVKGKRIVITDVRCVEMESYTVDPDAIQPDELYGRAVASLISPGTEIAVYKGNLNKSFPIRPGYALVLRVEKVGTSIEDVKEGDCVLCMASHQSHVIVRRKDAVIVPEGLNPFIAPFARLAGVSMTTLNTTKAHPPQLVLVNGLGVIGNIAAQIFYRCGYDVVACDGDANRCELLAAKGLPKVFTKYPNDNSKIIGHVSLVLECRGVETEVLEDCNIVRKGGEIVLVSVPWENRTSLKAFDLMNAIFHRYAILRSGWEWEISTDFDDTGGFSVMGNFRAAMEWLRDGSISVEDIYKTVNPMDIQMVYQNIDKKKSSNLTYLLDWSLLN